MVSLECVQLNVITHCIIDVLNAQRHQIIRKSNSLTSNVSGVEHRLVYNNDEYADGNGPRGANSSAQCCDMCVQMQFFRIYNVQ